eukprot:1178388-Prorocentrum_minimum.AAC.1
MELNSLWVAAKVSNPPRPPTHPPRVIRFFCVSLSAKRTRVRAKFPPYDSPKEVKGSGSNITNEATATPA